VEEKDSFFFLDGGVRTHVYFKLL